MRVVMSYSGRDYNLAMSAVKVLIGHTDFPEGKFYLYGSAMCDEPDKAILERGVKYIKSQKDSSEYPRGPNIMFAGFMRHIWKSGWDEPVFMCEADGFPTCRDWYERVKRGHEETGKLCSGSMVDWVEPKHINGNMVIDPAIIGIAPWITRVTVDPWDCFHAELFERFGGANREILNPRRRLAYYPTKWWLEQRQEDGYKPAWVHGCQNFQMWERILEKGFGDD